MAIEVTAALVARLLIHIRERLLEEIESIDKELPATVDRHTERVFIGDSHKDLIKMVAERMNPDNWEDKPLGPPKALDGLKGLVDEVQHYINSLPRDSTF